MNTNPYTLKEAETMCEQYQHLVNRPIESGKDWRIDCVTVSPIGFVDQWLCAYAYLDSGSAITARSFYNHTAYTVILISVYDRAADKLIFKDLSVYLAEHETDLPLPMKEQDRIDGSSRIISIEAYPRRKE